MLGMRLDGWPPAGLKHDPDRGMICSSGRHGGIDLAIDS
jgi:hypothetical protein